MSCPRKIRCFHKRFCNSVPAVVIALGHPRTIQPHSRPSQREDPTPTHTHPRVMITYLLLLNESDHSYCISFAIAESGWSIVSTGVWFGFRCSTASLTKFTTRLSKAVAWAFSSKSGLMLLLLENAHATALLSRWRTNVEDWLFQWDVVSTCDGLSFQQSVYNPLDDLYCSALATEA